MNRTLVRSPLLRKKHGGFSCALEGFAFEQAVARVLAVLDSEGFRVFADIDIKAIMAEKLKIDRYHRVLEAGFPSSKSGRSEDGASRLTPCNVVIREGTDGCVVVEFTDPLAGFPTTKGRDPVQLPEEVQRGISRLRAALIGLCYGDDVRQASVESHPAPLNA